MANSAVSVSRAAVLILLLHAVWAADDENGQSGSPLLRCNPSAGWSVYDVSVQNYVARVNDPSPPPATMRLPFSVIRGGLQLRCACSGSEGDLFEAHFDRMTYDCDESQSPGVATCKDVQRVIKSLEKTTSQATAWLDRRRTGTGFRTTVRYLNSSHALASNPARQFKDHFFEALGATGLVGSDATAGTTRDGDGGSGGDAGDSFMVAVSTTDPDDTRIGDKTSSLHHLGDGITAVHRGQRRLVFDRGGSLVAATGAENVELDPYAAHRAALGQQRPGAIAPPEVTSIRLTSELRLKRNSSGAAFAGQLVAEASSAAVVAGWCGRGSGGHAASVLDQTAGYSLLELHSAANRRHLARLSRAAHQAHMHAKGRRNAHSVEAAARRHKAGRRDHQRRRMTHRHKLKREHSYQLQQAQQIGGGIKVDKIVTKSKKDRTSSASQLFVQIVSKVENEILGFNDTLSYFSGIAAEIADAHRQAKMAMNFINDEVQCDLLWAEFTHSVRTTATAAATDALERNGLPAGIAALDLNVTRATLVDFLNNLVDLLNAKALDSLPSDVKRAVKGNALYKELWGDLFQRIKNDLTRVVDERLPPLIKRLQELQKQLAERLDEIGLKTCTTARAEVLQALERIEPALRRAKKVAIGFNKALLWVQGTIGEVAGVLHKLRDLLDSAGLFTAAYHREFGNDQWVMLDIDLAASASVDAPTMSAEASVSLDVKYRTQWATGPVAKLRVAPSVSEASGFSPVVPLLSVLGSPEVPVTSNPKTLVTEVIPRAFKEAFDAIIDDRGLRKFLVAKFKGLVLDPNVLGGWIARPPSSYLAKLATKTEEEAQKNGPPSTKTKLLPEKDKAVEDNKVEDAPLDPQVAPEETGDRSTTDSPPQGPQELLLELTSEQRAIHAEERALARHAHSRREAFDALYLEAARHLSFKTIRGIGASAQAQALRHAEQAVEADKRTGGLPGGSSMRFASTTPGYSKSDSSLSAAALAEEAGIPVTAAGTAVAPSFSDVAEGLVIFVEQIRQEVTNGINYAALAAEIKAVGDKATQDACNEAVAQVHRLKVAFLRRAEHAVRAIESLAAQLVQQLLEGFVTTDARSMMAAASRGSKAALAAVVKTTRAEFMSLLDGMARDLETFLKELFDMLEGEAGQAEDAVKKIVTGEFKRIALKLGLAPKLKFLRRLKDSVHTLFEVVSDIGALAHDMVPQLIRVVTDVGSLVDKGDGDAERLATASYLSIYRVLSENFAQLAKMLGKLNDPSRYAVLWPDTVVSGLRSARLAAAKLSTLTANARTTLECVFVKSPSALRTISGAVTQLGTSFTIRGIKDNSNRATTLEIRGELTKARNLLKCTSSVVKPLEGFLPTQEAARVASKAMDRALAALPHIVDLGSATALVQAALPPLLDAMAPLLDAIVDENKPVPNKAKIKMFMTKLVKLLGILEGGLIAFERALKEGGATVPRITTALVSVHQGIRWASQGLQYIVDTKLSYSNEAFGANKGEDKPALFLEEKEDEEEADDDEQESSASAAAAKTVGGAWRSKARKEGRMSASQAILSSRTHTSDELASLKAEVVAMKAQVAEVHEGQKELLEGQERLETTTSELADAVVASRATAFSPSYERASKFFDAMEPKHYLSCSGGRVVKPGTYQLKPVFQRRFEVISKQVGLPPTLTYGIKIQLGITIQGQLGMQLEQAKCVSEADAATAKEEVAKATAKAAENGAETAFVESIDSIEHKKPEEGQPAEAKRSFSAKKPVYVFVPYFYVQVFGFGNAGLGLPGLSFEAAADVEIVQLHVPVELHLSVLEGAAAVHAEPSISGNAGKVDTAIQLLNFKIPTGGLEWKGYDIMLPEFCRGSDKLNVCPKAALPVKVFDVKPTLVPVRTPRPLRTRECTPCDYRFEKWASWTTSAGTWDCPMTPGRLVALAGLGKGVNSYSDKLGEFFLKEIHKRDSCPIKNKECWQRPGQAAGLVAICAESFQPTAGENGKYEGILAIRWGDKTQIKGGGGSSPNLPDSFWRVTMTRQPGKTDVVSGEQISGDAIKSDGVVRNLQQPFKELADGVFQRMQNDWGIRDHNKPWHYQADVYSPPVLSQIVLDSESLKYAVAAAGSSSMASAAQMTLPDRGSAGDPAALARATSPDPVPVPAAALKNERAAIGFYHAKQSNQAVYATRQCVECKSTLGGEGAPRIWRCPRLGRRQRLLGVEPCKSSYSDKCQFILDRGAHYLVQESLKSRGGQSASPEKLRVVICDERFDNNKYQGALFLGGVGSETVGASSYHRVFSLDLASLDLTGDPKWPKNWQRRTALAPSAVVRVEKRPYEATNAWLRGIYRLVEKTEEQVNQERIRQQPCLFEPAIDPAVARKSKLFSFFGESLVELASTRREEHRTNSQCFSCKLQVIDNGSGGQLMLQCASKTGGITTGWKNLEHPARFAAMGEFKSDDFARVAGRFDAVALAVMNAQDQKFRSSKGYRKWIGAGLQDTYWVCDERVIAVTTPNTDIKGKEVGAGDGGTPADEARATGQKKLVGGNICMHAGTHYDCLQWKMPMDAFNDVGKHIGMTLWGPGKDKAMEKVEIYRPGQTAPSGFKKAWASGMPKGLSYFFGLKLAEHYYGADSNWSARKCPTEIETQTA